MVQGMKTIIALVAVFFVTGCASANKMSIQYNGQIWGGIITESERGRGFAAEDPIDVFLKKDNIVLMDDWEKSDVTISKSVDIEAVEGAFNLGVDALDIGLNIVDVMTNPFAAIAAATGVSRNAIHTSQNINLRKNSAYYQIKFDKEVEVERKRGLSVRHLLHEILPPEERDLIHAKETECSWLYFSTPRVRFSDGKLYGSDCDKKTKTCGDLSLVSSKLLVGLRYYDEDEGKPEGDPCSAKEAQKIMDRVIDRLTSRKR